MTASFRKIDYSLRPAKHAERRMFLEVFRKLRPFQPIEDYLYIGFGSLWFAEFALFHRALGVKEMISIEQVATAEPRFEANKPFRAITVDYRESSRVLPELDWTRRQFVWLDYDKQLNPNILQDATTVATRALSGTAFAVSLQCQQAREIEDAAADPQGPSAIVRFRDRFGRQRIEPGVSEDELFGWPFGKLSRRIVLGEIEAALGARNTALSAEQKMSFHPICELEYDDDAKMTTIVGVFASAEDAGLVDSCGFEQLDFMPEQGRLVRIRVPRLTVREIRQLEQQLPGAADGEIEFGAIPAGEAQRFIDLYRYLPNFAILEH